MVVPPQDFFSFRGVAASFAQISLPEFYKRAPGYPLLMAGARLFMPGPDPFLAGAFAVNVAAALVAAAAVYIWARRHTARGALLAAALVAAYSQFALLAVMPLCEMALVAFILLAAASAGRGSGWAYFWAAAAAATRYEGLVLIPLVLWADARHWRGRPRLWGYAALALVPMALWLALSLVHSRFVNPYVEEIQALAPSGWVFPRELLGSFLDLRNIGWTLAAVALAAVALYGVLFLARRDASARVYGGFALAYVAIHIIFPFTFRRFVFPIWPLLAVGLVIGGREVWRRIAKTERRGLWTAAAALAAAALAFGIGWRLLASPIGKWDESAPGYALGFATFAAALIWAWREDRRLSVRRWAAGLLSSALILGMVVDANGRFFVREYRTVKAERMALRAAALWLDRAAAPDDKVVATDDVLFRYYMGSDGPTVMAPVAFRTANFDLWTARARRAGVAYICVDSRSFAEPEGYFSARTGAQVLKPLTLGVDRKPCYIIAKVAFPNEYVYVYRLGVQPPVPLSFNLVKE